MSAQGDLAIFDEANDCYIDLQSPKDKKTVFSPLSQSSVISAKHAVRVTSPHETNSVEGDLAPTRVAVATGIGGAVSDIDDNGDVIVSGLTFK